MAEPKYNMTVPEAIEEMQGQLDKMRAQEDRFELAKRGLTVDEAFEKGYEIAIFDLRTYTGPKPSEENQ